MIHSCKKRKKNKEKDYLLKNEGGGNVFGIKAILKL